MLDCVAVAVQMVDGCGCFHVDGLTKLDDMKTVSGNLIMPVRHPRSGSRCPTTAFEAPLRVAAGQTSVCDLRAGTSIVAVQGDLQLGFRDRSLAWLGDAVPLTSITLREGEQFVMPQHGAVSIGAARATSASFVVQAPHAENAAHGAVHRTVGHLTALIRSRLRRAA